jgi:hypothetical protein
MTSQKTIMNEMTMRVAMRSDKSTQEAELATGWPEFVKIIPAAGEALPQLRYWSPERSGDASTDTERGRGYFHQALAISLQPTSPMFLAHVLVGMFGNYGPMESGFVEAMLEKSVCGKVSPKLTHEEAATVESTPDAIDRLRDLEGDMAAALSLRSWVPELPRTTLVSLLAGEKGPHIGGAITMIARTVINSARH